MPNRYTNRSHQACLNCRYVWTEESLPSEPRPDPNSDERKLAVRVRSLSVQHARVSTRDARMASGRVL